ncbi:hypothetical protein U1Q18_016473 [Sarracenia purpurea var. burkii]
MGKMEKSMEKSMEKRVRRRRKEITSVDITTTRLLTMPYTDEKGKKKLHPGQCALPNSAPSLVEPKPTIINLDQWVPSSETSSVEPSPRLSNTTYAEP